MSFVGKILVVVIVVLSLLFMAFAGAVFAIHQNWNGKHTAAQTQLVSAQGALATSQEELETAKSKFNADLQLEKQRADRFQAENTGLLAQVATLNEQNQLLGQQRETQTGLAMRKSREARFRQEESELQRIENEKLQSSLDKTAALARDLKDQVFGREQDLKALAKKHDLLVEQVAFLRKIVAAEGLETDPRVVARMQSPPPPVDGLVSEVSRNRANRVEFVDISIGSDDGIVKGHHLDIVRVLEGGESKWLGIVRIVDVRPDNAVGQVITAAKNGIIQEGDNVTSKL